ncbi:MAG TPA: hypothetical protein VNU46_07630, partial [Gemmatimonadaceae bacterium]|nr:hypothetical protein [Gemmatimonadaceae bacterium]
MMALGLALGARDLADDLVRAGPSRMAALDASVVTAAEVMGIHTRRYRRICMVIGVEQRMGRPPRCQR